VIGAIFVWHNTVFRKKVVQSIFVFVTLVFLFYNSGLILDGPRKFFTVRDEIHKISHRTLK